MHNIENSLKVQSKFSAASLPLHNSNLHAPQLTRVNISKRLFSNNFFNVCHLERTVVLRTKLSSNTVDDGNSGVENNNNYTCFYCH